MLKIIEKDGFKGLTMRINSCFCKKITINLADSYHCITDLKHGSKHKLSKISIFNSYDLKILLNRTFSVLKNITQKNIIDFLQALAFCSLFGCSVVVMPDLKNGLNVGKQFFFLFTAGPISAICVYKFRRNFNKSTYRVSWTDIFVFTYLIYVLSKTWINQPAFMADLKLTELLLMGLVYLISKSILKRQSNVQYYLIIMAFLGFGLYQAIYGLQQLYGYETSYHSSFKVTGSFFNPAPFSGYLISIFPVGLAVYHFIPNQGLWKKAMKYLGLTTALIILLIIPSTLSRASWVALFASIMVIYGKHHYVGNLVSDYLKSRLTRVITLASVVIMLASIATGLFYWKKDSALGRILIWEVTLDMIVENPFFGVGLNQYNPQFGHYQAGYFQSDQYSQEKAMVAGKGEYAFNEPLLITAENGIVGLLLFLGIIISALSHKDITNKKLSHNNRYLTISAYSGLISILVFSLFSYPFSISPILLNFFFFLAVLSAEDYKRTILEIPITRAGKLVMFIGVVAFTIWVIANTKEKHQAFKQWENASEIKSYGDYDEAIGIMKEVEPVLNNNGNFMLEYGHALAFNKNYEKGIRVLEKASHLISDPYLFNSLGHCYQGTKDYKKAEKAYIHAFYLNPHKFYPRYLLAKLYFEMGEREKAIETARLLLGMKVKVPSMAIEEMKEEMEELIENYRKFPSSRE